MAKSSRASTKKANNQRLKANVFGPIESARQERLSAKLLEIASQPKPVPERDMEDATEKPETQDKAGDEQKADDSKRAIRRMQWSRLCVHELAGHLDSNILF